MVSIRSTSSAIPLAAFPTLGRLMLLGWSKDGDDRSDALLYLELLVNPEIPDEVIPFHAALGTRGRVKWDDGRKLLNGNFWSYVEPCIVQA